MQPAASSQISTLARTRLASRCRMGRISRSVFRPRNTRSTFSSTLYDSTMPAAGRLVRIT
jgi:hypothetical protein